MRNGKAMAQRRHAKRRMFERFGVTINRRDLCELAEAIQEGRAEFYSRQSRRITKWIVRGFYGIPDPILAVYDTLRGTVVTVMPVKR